MSRLTRITRELPAEPEELLRRVDHLYADLAGIYVRIGRVLGVRPCRCELRAFKTCRAGRQGTAAERRTERPRSP